MSAALQIVPTLEPQQIKRQGLYHMTYDHYHWDPCPTPSLSAGMIEDIRIAPALCRENSARLNPDFNDDEDEDGGKFTIGTVSHVIHLEPELFEVRIAEIPFSNWRTKEAKAARANALAEGRTPILSKHLASVRAARAAFGRNEFVSKAFTKGKAEHCLFWKHPIYKIWCRARPDFISNSRHHINDYKSTKNADPDDFPQHAVRMGYFRRAAWYLEGAECIFKRRPKHYWFINQEERAPHLISVVELDANALDQGKAENDEAARLFARCLKTDDWFGYRHKTDQSKDRAFRVGLPAYYYQKFDQGRQA